MSFPEVSGADRGPGVEGTGSTRVSGRSGEDPASGPAPESLTLVSRFWSVPPSTVQRCSHSLRKRDSLFLWVITHTLNEIYSTLPHSLLGW